MSFRETISRFKKAFESKRVRMAAGISSFFVEVGIAGIVLGIVIYLLSVLKAGINDTEASNAIGTVQGYIGTYGPLAILISIFGVILLVVVSSFRKGEMER